MVSMEFRVAVQKVHPGATRILLFLFFILASQVTATSKNHANGRGCSSSCGAISNVTYPFRLTTDPPNCGDTDYELTCRDGHSLIAKINSSSYFVKQISYPTRTLRLVDTQLSLSSCAIPRNSPSIDDLTSDPRYRGRVADTDTTFFSCSRGTNLSSEIYRRVPCLDEGDDEVYVAYSVYKLSSLQGSCKFVARVPTILQPVLYPSYESIEDLLESGFDVGWSPDCRDCVNNGRDCILNSADTPSVYKCHKGDASSRTMKSFHSGFSILCAILILKGQFPL